MEIQPGSISSSVAPVEIHNDIEKNNVDKGTDIENYDSLEVENIHIYENVESTEPTDTKENCLMNALPITREVPVVSNTSVPEKVNVKSLTTRFENKEKPPIGRKNEYENIAVRNQKSPVLLGNTKNEKVIEQKCNSRTSKSDLGSSSSLESDKVQKIIYDRGSLPPCLRAKHIKSAIKTRSLDENEFAKEFAVGQPLERRKSVDENFGSKLNTVPKVLNQPKPIPLDGEKLDIHLAHSIDNVSIGLPEQKLNRERIEKYKEERRKFLHDKYRSESFKDDKDKLLTRLKQKTVKSKVEDVEMKMESKDGRTFNSDPGPNSELSKLGARRKYSEPEVLESHIDISLNEFTQDSLECDTNLDENNKKDVPFKNDFEKAINKNIKTNKNINERSNEFKESIKYKTALFESQANQSKQLSDVKSLMKSSEDSNKINIKKSSVNVRNKISAKEKDNDVLGEVLIGSDFIRNRRKDEDGTKVEKRRHTYESRERERESESDRNSRISLESRSPR